MMQTNLISLPSTSNSAQPKTVTPTPFPVEIYITLTPYGFVPNALMVKSGTKITWINKSGIDATVTPNTHIAGFPTGMLGSNSTQSFTFTTLGRYIYNNQKKSIQTGIIIVE